MAYDITWLIEKRVIHVHVHGNLSPMEARLAYDGVSLYRSLGAPPVHIVLEHTGLEQFPLTLNFYNFMIRETRPESRSIIVIVGTERRARFIGRLLAQAVNTRAISADTLSEGLGALCRLDSSLPNICNS